MTEKPYFTGISIIYSDGDDDDEEEIYDAESGTEESYSSDPPIDQIEPEQVDVFSDLEEEPEQDDNTGTDALDGADLFKDITVDADEDVGSKEEIKPELHTIPRKRKIPEFNPKEQNPLADDECEGKPMSSDSESSVDLADLELDLTAEERRSLRRKKKLDRMRSKQNQLLKERQRQLEFSKAKKDRFFDKSRIIPNEIYFGDIVVPLHVLHSYGETEKSSHETKRASTRPISSSLCKQKANVGLVPRHPAATPIRRAPGYKSARVVMMKRYLSAAGIRQKKYRASLKKCSDDAERISLMMNLLREQGLEGEPTLARCRLLRRNHSSDEENSLGDSDDLDTSVIINPKGRTLRSGTTIIVQNQPDDTEEGADDKAGVTETGAECKEEDGGGQQTSSAISEGGDGIKRELPDQSSTGTLQKSYLKEMFKMENTE